VNATGLRTAKCGCGALTATTAGEPATVYACACLRCQQKSGGAFTYSALFALDAVTVRGDYTTWRHNGDSGRWVETNFCPVCGITVFSRGEGFPASIIVAVGCFSDPDFAAPTRMFWASRHHRWLTFPDGVELQDTQPG
jgi:hypothetical protein